MAQPRKKVAVVLSGGGAKGVAHIGALKVIDEAGIPIDYVVGTSMGAIIGGLYSIGYSPHQMDSLVSSQDWPFLLSDKTKRSEKTFLEKVESDTYVLSLPFKKNPKEVLPDGLIKGQNLDNLFTNLTVGFHDSISFNKLPTPFACVAVDLMKGEEVVFHSGALSEAMRASMAIPGAFTPVRIDSMVLVDGGLINNFPVDVARSMGAEIIVGVDVQSGPKKDDNIVTVADMVGKIVEITSKSKYAENRKETDVYIKVNVEGYNAASFNPEALDTLTRRGEEAARGEWTELIQLKNKIGVSGDYEPKHNSPYRVITPEDTIRIMHISFEGLDDDEKNWLMRKCLLKNDSKMTLNGIQEAISNIYGTQIYTNVGYVLNTTEGGYDLHFTLDNNRVNSFNLGIRFDSEEVASVLLNAQYQFNTRVATKAALTGRLGKRTGVRLDYAIFPNLLRIINLSYMYQYNDINIYQHGSREYNTTYGYNMAEIGYSNIFNQNLMLSLGVRYEHFNYKNFLFGDERNTMEVRLEGFFSYSALLRYETMDRRVFPNSGTSLRTNIGLYTDNMIHYKGGAPFAAASVWWESVFSITNKFTILPGAYGRVLMGNNFPYPFLNTMGGDTPGKYVPQQLPFTGIDFMGIFDNSLVVGKVKLRQRFGKNHYVNLTGNYALDNDNFIRILKGRQTFGASLGYGYNSVFGPLEGSFNWSNETKKLGFYLNIGYSF